MSHNSSKDQADFSRLVQSTLKEHREMKKETKDSCFLAKHEKANSLYGNLREFSGLFSNSPDSPQQKD